MTKKKKINKKYSFKVDNSLKNKGLKRNILKSIFIEKKTLRQIKKAI